MVGISCITGRAVPLDGDDLDTDRITPARYLKCVTFDGLGEYLFRDDRFDESGARRDHPLNDARFEGATILLCGRNFGCGSSREHAPQAISRAGFRALVGESFAGIFFGNQIALGVPCVSVAREHRAVLSALVQHEPETPLSIDLVACEVHAGPHSFPLSIEPSARAALLGGYWDPIIQLLEGNSDVRKLTERLPYLRWQRNV